MVDTPSLPVTGSCVHVYWCVCVCVHLLQASLDRTECGSKQGDSWWSWMQVELVGIKFPCKGIRDHPVSPLILCCALFVFKGAHKNDQLVDTCRVKARKKRHVEMPMWKSTQHKYTGQFLGVNASQLWILDNNVASMGS